MRYQDKSVLFIDNGLFCSLADHIAADFGKAYYYVPWESKAPECLLASVGVGYPNMERVLDPWSVIDDCDLLCCLDVYSGGLQVRERKRGMAVWGAGMGEELELLREDTKAYMKEQGAEIGPWHHVVGIDALRAFVQKHEDVYVKTSVYRGDFESHCCPNYDEAKWWLDKIERRLGPMASAYNFVVEEKVKDSCDLAYDGYTVDGRFPNATMIGCESKSQGYLGKFVPYDKVPEPLRKVNDLFAPTLKDYGYRASFAVECLHTKDGHHYVSDPACRFSSPCSELMQLMYTNLSEIVWEGAHGNLVDPESGGKWGAELMLFSSIAEENACPVWFPKSIAKNVKLHNAMIDEDGLSHVLPNPLSRDSNLGAVCAVGGTMKEAISKCCEYADQVRAPELTFSKECFGQIEESLEKLKDYGLAI